VEEKPAPKAAPDTARKTYETLRREIIEGRFIALYDYCSEEYAKAKFASESFRAGVASHPGLKDLGVTAEDLGRMEIRAVVATYFRLLTPAQKQHLVLAMSAVVITGEKKMKDGRVAVETDTQGTISRLIWVRESGKWKIDGEEIDRSPAHEGSAGK
jgi:hypothetical protein